MKFLTIAKFLLIIVLPVLLFLLVSNFVGLDNSFYQQKFSEYQTEEKVPNASSLHEKVMNFIRGKSNTLPEEFNEKEQNHLWDVRKIISTSTILLYLMIILFVLLLAISSFTIKVNNQITNFVGKVLVFGGFLTIVLGLILFLFINSDFSTAFESFHKTLFQKGTYAFESKELIVNLYPEQLFMELGLRISIWTIVSAVMLLLIGAFFMLKSKKNK